jgi:reverse transcriptase-like protein
MFICNFAHRAHHLVKLTRKGAEWEFGQKQIDAMADLKEALLSSPALRPINYHSGAPVILGVDTSQIAIGLILSQSDLDNPKLWYVAKFGSITLNDREARFSQPKLELYGLYWALRSLKLYLIGVRNLVIEVDAKYIKGMLSNPDIAPSASMNRWILSILLFHFTLVHVPGTHHGPDGLSRRRPQPGDEEEPDDDFDNWVDQVNGFMHFLNPLPSHHSAISISPPVTCFITVSGQLDEEEVDIDQGSGEIIEVSQTPYSIVSRSEAAVTADEKMTKVRDWLLTLTRPPAMSDAEYTSFMRYCTEFFVSDNRLWRKDSKGNHRVVVAQDRRLFLLSAAHDNVGHHGFYVTNALLTDRYWGRSCCTTSLGLFEPADSVNFVKHHNSRYPQSSQLPHLYSQRFTWILCISHRQGDTDTLSKGDAHSPIGRNGKSLERNQPNRSPTLYFTTSSIDGEPS